MALPLIAVCLGTTCASGGDIGSTIPMTLTQSDYGGGRIYLPVRFGNSWGPCASTRAPPRTRVTLAPWNKDLPTIGQSASTGASGRTTACDDVEAKNVELKASRGNNIARAKYEVTRCATGDGDDLLGLDFFKDTRFTLDFERREMVFFGKPTRLAAPSRFG